MKHFEHSGSSFDSLLEEDGIREEVEAVAIKRVIARQIQEAMRQQRKTKQAMARGLGTSRSQLDRLLDPKQTGVSLETIARAADVLGKRIVIRLADKTPPKRPRVVKKAFAPAKRRPAKPRTIGNTH